LRLLTLPLTLSYTQHVEADAVGLTIEELADQVGVPVRTIRYYIAEGLLPGPGARGKAASYGEAHALRLRLVRRLVEQRVPLAEIRERVTALEVGEVRALLAQAEGEAREIERAAAASSPAAYVAALLRRAQAARMPSNAATERRDRSQTVPPAPAWDALLRDRAPGVKRIPDMPRTSILPDDADGPDVPGKPTEAPPSRASFDSALPEHTLRNAPPVAARWRRMEIADGVELHVREDAQARARLLVERILRIAREHKGG
jgi:DNA-binding transcriptional MerR regulator